MQAILNHRNPLETDEPLRPCWLYRMLAGGSREAVFWILHALFWAGIGLLAMVMTLAFQSAVPHVGWIVLIRMTSGFVLTAGLRWVYRRRVFRQGSGWARWPLVLGCCVALGLLEILIVRGVMAAGLAFPGDVETADFKLLSMRVFAVALWSGLYFTFHLLEEARALELRATRAELAARENELRHLQAQMNPHFLFNALNAVLACKDDPEAVKDVTRSLAEYLRFLLQETRPLEPLAREFDALEKFLTVQAARFVGNLVCRIQADPAARPVMVPPMIVQPLLEDAFHHRLPTADTPLQIWLTARVEEGFLRVTVSNNGEWIPPYSNPEPGAGIRNLHQRLNLLLGPRARVERVEENGWIRTTIHIPLEKRPDARMQPPVSRAG